MLDFVDLLWFNFNQTWAREQTIFNFYPIANPQEGIIYLSWYDISSDESLVPALWQRYDDTINK